MNIKFEITEGKRFGRWTVKELRGRCQKTFQMLYLVSCDCGYKKVIQRRGLVSGKSKSCGCLNKEICSKHGLRNHPLYKTYRHMIDRCYNQKNKSFNDYGGRGIFVCDEWLGENGLLNFIKSMKKRPSKLHSIDRINNEKGYSPENCRWATKQVQNRNTRKNIKIKYNGNYFIPKDLDQMLGFNKGTISRRIRANWPMEKVLKTEIRKLGGVNGTY